MPLMVVIYGKGGIGKSTITANLAVAFSRKGKKVLQIGCDPKHDSTFSLTHSMIPTVVETLDKHRFHYEDISSEEIIHSGFADVSVVEAGGPPAGVGCGGYVIGETIQLLNNLDVFKDYEVVLFDVLGDIVCGGFSVPLQYAKYACIIVTDDFDSLFAGNRIAAAVVEKAKTYPVKLAGIIGNRCEDLSRINKFAEAIRSRVISAVKDLDEIRLSRIRGQTLFEMAEEDKSLSGLTEPFFQIADFLLMQPEPEACTPLFDRDMFKVFVKER